MISHRKRPPSFRKSPDRRSQGSALVIVLILLAVMTALIFSNGVVLQRLKVELQLLDAKQKHALEERGRVRPAQEAPTAPR